MRCDRVLVGDWAAASAPTPPRPVADAIWIGEAGDGETYHRTRAAAAAHLHARVARALAAGERVLIGADFPFGYPAGFARALTGRDGALALWDWLAAHVVDGADNANTRFALAAAINARFPGVGPFWGRPRSLDLPDLPERGTARTHARFSERRVVETLVRGAQPVWKLYTTGSVGSQAIMGIPRLAALRAAFPGRVAVWPFEPLTDAQVVLAEVYPSLLAPEVAAAGDPIKDRAQVRLLAHALAAVDLAPLLAPDAPRAVLAEEGWILGAGHETALRAALAG